MIGEPPHGTLKIGFVAKKDISFFDYGLKPNPEFPISTNAKLITTTLHQ